MIPQLFEINSQSKSQTPSSLAIIFFLLGLPNVYSILQQRSQHRASLSQSLPLKAIGLISATLVGTLSFLVF